MSLPSRESVSFLICSRSTFAEAATTASQMLFKEVYCLPSFEFSRLRRAHKFSIGFKSGEEGGQGSIQASLRPLLASQAVEYLDACDGALSCIKIMGFLNAEDFFLYHCLKKDSSRNRQQVWELSFSPSSIQKGPITSSLMIATHTSTPPPPCWCLTQSGAPVSITDPATSPSTWSINSHTHLI